MRPVPVPPGTAPRRGLLASMLTAGVAVLLPFQAEARAQGPATLGGQLSADQYYAMAMEAYEAADFTTALDRFRIGARATLRTATRPWVDSICFYTMIGECQARLGHLDEALTNYNTALRIHLGTPDWLLHAQFEPKVRPANRGDRPIEAPWGKSSRLSRPGVVASSVPVQVFWPASLVGEQITVHIPEQMRCLAVCLMGRREILGPVARFDPFSRETIEALAQRRVRRGHWSEVWVDVLLGLAFEAQGNPVQAKSHLQAALVMDGFYDHNLTGAALLGLGRLAAAEGRPIEAVKLFEEATYAAYAYGDLRVLAEAFRRARALNHQAGGGDLYAPLHTAADLYRRTGPALIHAEFLLAVAQDDFESRQSSQAQRAVAQVRSLLGRNDSRPSVLSNELLHLEGALALDKGDTQRGGALLAEALRFQKKASPRLLQLHQADELARGNNPQVTTRDALNLYAEMLTDPEANDWQRDPLDALAFLTDSHEEVYEHWFELAWSRREYEQAFEIAERARCHRYLSTLPLGGRVLGLRWLLAGSEDALSDEARLERRDLLLRFPKYAEVQSQWEKTASALSQFPLVPADAQSLNRQQALLAELARLDDQREAIHHTIAVLPEPVVPDFPPQLAAEPLRARLSPRQAVWSFYRTSQGLFSFWLTSQSLSACEIARPDDVTEQTKHLLESLGQVDGDRGVSPSTLAGDAWRDEAGRLLKMLVGRPGGGLFASVDDLVVVPDGVLWFVPFEALLDAPAAKASGEIDSLIARLRIRYAPTASLALAGKPATASRSKATLVVGGRLHPRENPSTSEQLAQQLRSDDPSVVFLPVPRRNLAAPRFALAGRAVVWEELGLDDLASFATGWQQEKRSPGDSASTPRAPEQLVLTGLRTPAEVGLRDANVAETSRQLYFAMMRLVLNGSRTVLASRWRVGGESTARLVHEFVQELPFVSASEAWQRAVLLSATRPLEPSNEPRLILEDSQDAPAPVHPFFWAGYMLVDVGGE